MDEMDRKNGPWLNSSFSFLSYSYGMVMPYQSKMVPNKLFCLGGSGWHGLD